MVTTFSTCVYALLAFISPSNPPALVGQIVTTYKYNTIQGRCYEYTTRLGVKIVQDEWLWVKPASLNQCIENFGRYIVSEETEHDSFN